MCLWVPREQDAPIMASHESENLTTQPFPKTHFSHPYTSPFPLCSVHYATPLRRIPMARESPTRGHWGAQVCHVSCSQTGELLQDRVDMCSTLSTVGPEKDRMRRDSPMNGMLISHWRFWFCLKGPCFMLSLFSSSLPTHKTMTPLTTPQWAEYPTTICSLHGPVGKTRLNWSPQPECQTLEI